MSAMPPRAHSPGPPPAESKPEPESPATEDATAPSKSSGSILSIYTLLGLLAGGLYAYDFIWASINIAPSFSVFDREQAISTVVYLTINLVNAELAFITAFIMLPKGFLLDLPGGETLAPKFESAQGTLITKLPAFRLAWLTPQTGHRALLYLLCFYLYGTYLVAIFPLYYMGLWFVLGGARPQQTFWAWAVMTSMCLVIDAFFIRAAPSSGADDDDDDDKDEEDESENKKDE